MGSIQMQVRDALLDPQTVERLQAVRKYVENADAPFPPRPAAANVPQPLYGAVSMDLEFWKQRRINVITWNAVDMLFSERQLKHYRDDMDVPRYEDTSQGKKKAAELAAAGSSAPTSSDQEQ